MSVNQLNYRPCTAVAVDDSSDILVASNPRRQYLALQNVGTSDVTINFGEAAVAGQGLVIFASGGWVWEASSVPKNDIYAICADDASSTVIVVQGP